MTTLVALILLKAVFTGLCFAAGAYTAKRIHMRIIAKRKAKEAASKNV